MRNGEPVPSLRGEYGRGAGTLILEKMRMKTNAEVTHYAFQNKLVD